MNHSIHGEGVLTKSLRNPDQKAISKTTVLLEGLARISSVKIVERVNLEKRANCNDEKGKLKEAVVSLPTFLDWGTPINVAEAANMANKPDRLEAVNEHMKLIETLLSCGVKLQVIAPSESRLEGVYTRDPAFVIGDRAFRANLVAEPRKPEHGTFIRGIVPPEEVKIEGGNVVVDGNEVFLGVGDRTNTAAVEWLQGILGNTFQVIPIKLIPGVLHLDCAFSPIARPNGKAGGAIIYPNAFASDKDLKLFRSIYGRIFKIGEVEYKLLGANTLALDPETRIVNPSCQTIIDMLKGELHQNVIPVRLDQVVLAEGYARCCVMPLVRE